MEPNLERPGLDFCRAPPPRLAGLGDRLVENPGQIDSQFIGADLKGPFPGRRHAKPQRAPAAGFEIEFLRSVDNAMRWKVGSPCDLAPLSSRTCQFHDGSGGEGRHSQELSLRVRHRDVDDELRLRANVAAGQGRRFETLHRMRAPVDAGVDEAATADNCAAENGLDAHCWLSYEAESDQRQRNCMRLIGPLEPSHSGATRHALRRRAGRRCGSRRQWPPRLSSGMRWASCRVKPTFGRRGSGATECRRRHD